MAGSGDEWKVLCVVRGHHAYKDVWDPFLEDDFKTKHQRCNPHDKYAIADLPVDTKYETVVGHLPKEISEEFCLFIHNGGSITGVEEEEDLGQVKLCITQKYQYMQGRH